FPTPYGRSVRVGLVSPELRCPKPDGWCRSMRDRFLGRTSPKPGRRPGIRRHRPEVENLERRVALSKAGTWTELLNPMPGSGSGSGEMLLLSDGSVMVQGGGASGLGFKDWYRLTPDSHGDYADGTWCRLAPMFLPRLDYAAVTLPDGRVMVLGGEYTP